jgi:hypothetical protein
VKSPWAAPRQTSNKRATERVNLMLPARLTWKDQRGSTRFASVITRDISEFGVFVECQSPISISQFRLVQFQLERDVRDVDGLPESLKQGRLLSAVYRVHPPTRAGGRQGLALRLMVDPRRRAQPEAARDAAAMNLVAAAADENRATA